MRPRSLSMSSAELRPAGLAVLTVLALTALMLVVGRATLGEAVIALLYVVPVGWATSRWGSGCSATRPLATASASACRLRARAPVRPQARSVSGVLAASVGASGKVRHRPSGASATGVP